MEIKNLHFFKLRNNEYFQFHTEFKALVEETGAMELKVESLFVSNYVPSYVRVDDTMKKIKKNSFTEQRHKKDVTRDGTFRVNNSIVNLAQSSLDPEVIDAARRLKIVFDTYGNVAKLPLNEETSAIYNLVSDIRSKCAADAALIGLTPWIDKLDAENRDYEALVKSGYEETAALQTEYNVKQARRLADDDYYKIIRRISAHIEIEGASRYANFVTRLNLQIDKYNNILASRYGRAAAKKEKEEGAEEIES